ncbi:MAG TPA: NADPH:quinone reductase [Tepidisphaeraceae bacterium]|jgi:NADPH2:quinone reductase|nr:NADPH:quinone reductase [Tepidisphaeraceae bacterium]
MKAILVHGFGGPEVLKLEEVADAKAGKGQVVVRAKAVGVNPVDTYVRKGIYGPKEFPYVPGNDAAGIVESVGEGVTKFKAGDRVYVAGAVAGAYAELVLCEEKNVHPLPGNVTFAQGATVGVPYATAYRALHVRGGMKPGEVVLVHGASGSVGSAGVQMARAFGAKVIGTAGSAEGMKLVKEQGAYEAFNHHEADYTQKIMEYTNGVGVDLIIEALANVNLDKDLKMLAKRGRVVVVGNRGRIEIDPRETMSRDADIRGMALQHAGDAELAGIHMALGAGLENGTLRPIVGMQMPLAEAGRAHEEVLKSHHGKIVLVP